MKSMFRIAPPNPHRQLLADGALVVVTLIWGATFVMIKDVLEQVPTMLFLAVRFAFGALSLALVITLARRWRGMSWRELRWGTLIGVVLWLAYALQTVGLEYTTATNAGFITGLYIVLVPLFALPVLKERPGGWAVIGLALATLGLCLLGLRLDQGFALNAGDAMVLGCAVGFALQVVLVARVAHWADPLRMAMLQIAVAGVLNCLTSIAFERPVPGMGLEIWAAAAFLGVAATGLAIALIQYVLRFTSTIHAALIFALEPVFAAVFGVWLQNDYLGVAGIVGAVLILVGMLLAELGPNLRPWGSKLGLPRLGTRDRLGSPEESP
jgi:drug/metabolite transporter (DMT)-like permease